MACYVYELCKLRADEETLVIDAFRLLGTNAKIMLNHRQLSECLQRVTELDDATRRATYARLYRQSLDYDASAVAAWLQQDGGKGSADRTQLAQFCRNVVSTYVLRFLLHGTKIPIMRLRAGISVEEASEALGLKSERVHRDL